MNRFITFIKYIIPIFSCHPWSATHVKNSKSNIRRQTIYRRNIISFNVSTKLNCHYSGKQNFRFSRTCLTNDFMNYR